MFRRAGPTRFMYGLGRALPPALGMVVVWVIAGLLILLRPSTYDAALRNLRHVLPPDTSAWRLKWLVWRQVYYRVKGYYDFFHNIGRDVGVADFRPPVRICLETQRYLTEAAFSGRGVLILGTHTSNYDLCGCALGEYLPIPPFALSIAEPAPGLQFVNDLRSRVRGEITPITPESLRDAIQCLQSGGIVMTGVDRPLVAGNAPVTFFGVTAYLPTGYIRIPLMTDCLVMVIAFRYDGKAYHILGSEPMEMLRTGNRKHDEAINLQRVLTEVEVFVRQTPDQWMVTVPVWLD